MGPDKAYKYVLVGAGKMGSALAQGWLDKAVVAPGELAVLEPQPAEHIQALAAAGKIDLNPDLAASQSGLHAVVIAVKPQMVAGVLPQVKPLLGPGTVCLSIAAGISLHFFATHLGADAAVARAMPNTPAAIGKGAAALVFGPHTRDEQRQTCRQLLQAVGQVYELDRESQMDAVTALSGSGPAYVFLLIECMIEAASAIGLPKDLARRLAVATVAGAGALAEQVGDDPARLRENVTSPGGTTAAAMDVLMGEGGLPSLIRRAMQQAAARSKELGLS